MENLQWLRVQESTISLTPEGVLRIHLTIGSIFPVSWKPSRGSQSTMRTVLSPRTSPLRLMRSPCVKTKRQCPPRRSISPLISGLFLGMNLKADGRCLWKSATLLNGPDRDVGFGRRPSTSCLPSTFATPWPCGGGIFRISRTISCSCESSFACDSELRYTHPLPTYSPFSFHHDMCLAMMVECAQDLGYWDRPVFGNEAHSRWTG